MEKLNIAWGEVRDPATLTEQKTITHRKSIIKTDDRDGGERPPLNLRIVFQMPLVELEGKHLIVVKIMNRYYVTGLILEIANLQV